MGRMIYTKCFFFRSVTIAYPGDRMAKKTTISWYWLPVSAAVTAAVASSGAPNPSQFTTGEQPFHTSELTPGNYSQFPSEYVLLDNYTEGRYLFFSQEYDSGQTGPLSIGDVIPNFAEMRKL